MDRKTNGDRRQSSEFPIWIVWQTGAPVMLDCGACHATGNAMPQVRSFELLAALGDLDAQLTHVQTAIVDALAQILVGMQPSRAQLAELRDEIASATLVAANPRLAAVGVVLLDLNIDHLTTD